MTNDLIDHAYQLLKTNPNYLADARQFARVNNTVIGSLLSLSSGNPRWATEAAVKSALQRIRLEEGKEKRASK